MKHGGRLTTTTPPLSGPDSQGMKVQKFRGGGCAIQGLKSKDSIRRLIMESIKDMIIGLWEKHPKKKWLVIGLAIGWAAAKYL